MYQIEKKVVDKPIFNEYNGTELIIYFKGENT